ncbi:glycosyltransferase family A protein [Labilibaculum antarcticum]|uniref:Glycosyl transferase n=1 Tax=Labilibaculum antarcticum TaxID=1717717 RepID=A0A1Y1CRS0_9BACT|nr:glycosyltransferase family 2 protein [Labilibaculum antarcticum]BAX82632.1 glycosyl transferase [Labilibaculum antarcticum]
MKQITIFTPSYNRSHLLLRLYESLKKQSNRSFKWLIVDDGSYDDTKQVVHSWIKEGIIEIRYYYQENQGMHGAHNSAYELIDTELNVCIDSDDYLADNAVDKILKVWNENSNSNLAGIIGLDATNDGGIIGSLLPDTETVTLSGFYANGGTGDKKLVYRTEVVNEYPKYGIYSGERLVPLGSKYILIDQDYELLVMNEVICVVEYQEDGSSGTIFKQYKQSPKGFAEARRVSMQYGIRFRDRFRAAIHYVSSVIFINDYKLLRHNSNLGLVFLAIPFGIILNIYIRLRIRFS